MLEVGISNQIRGGGTDIPQDAPQFNRCKCTVLQVTAGRAVDVGRIGII